MTDNALDDKALRKAWLKRMFGSFEYHEDMLRFHRQWLAVMRQALDRAEHDDGSASRMPSYKTVREEAAHFRARYMHLLECNDDLGKYKKDEWQRYYASATVRSIPDYNRDLCSEGDMLAWMTEKETAELNKSWGPMARMALNIQYTVDGNWDAHPAEPYWILEEQYTGAISWPADWREDLLGKQGATLAAMEAPRIKSGEPVPPAGNWQALDNSGSRVRAQVGDALPDLRSPYGITVWQRVGD